MFSNDKPEQKRKGGEGAGWLRYPDTSHVVRITCSGCMQIRHNLQRLGWVRVLPQW